MRNLLASNRLGAPAIRGQDASGENFATKLALAGLVIAASFVPAAPAGSQETDPAAHEAISPDTVVSGEVIVTFRSGTSEEAREQLLALVQGDFIRDLGGNAVVVKVPVGSEVSASGSLELDPNVLSAKPNDKVQN